MVSLPVFNKSGTEVGKYEIDPDAIAPKISQQLLHDVVVMYQANAAPGHAQHEGPQRRGRHDEEDVSPEGHGQRPRRLAPRAAAPRRLSRVCPAAARLLAIACRGRPCRPPRGWRSPASCKSNRRRGDRRAGVQRAEDQGDGRHPEGPEADRHEHAGDHGRPRPERLSRAPAISTR